MVARHHDGVMTIRLAEPRDAAVLRRIYAPAIDTPISFELEAPSVGEMRGRIERTLPHLPWLVAEREGEVVGYAYANPFGDRAAYRWSVTTSIYVDPGAHRRGNGRGLYTALLGLLEVMGYREAFAGITLPNTASVALHESVGFVRVALYRRVGWKLGRWHDVGWWQRPITDGDGDDPSPPLKVNDLAASELERAMNQHNAS